MTKKHKNIILNVSVLIVTVIIFLILAEIGFRFFYPQNLSFVKFDPVLGFRHIPNFKGQFNSPFTDEFETTVKINSRGLRDYEYPHKKNGSFRILVLGDSMTFGEGVEINETYPKLLEKKLNRKFKIKFEVINSGIRGYGPDNEYLFLKYEGLKYDPDLIVLGFFVDNDINNNDLIIFNNSQVLERRLNSPGLFMKVRRWLSRESHLYNFVILVLRSNRLTNNVMTKMGIFVPKPKYFDEQNPEILEKNVKKTKDVVKLINNFSEKNGAEFVVLLIPTETQVSSQKGLEIYAKMKEINDVKIFDLLSSFKSSDKDLFFKQNKHLNKKGHELASDVFYETLINSSLIK